MSSWQFEESMDFDYRIQLLEQLSFVLKRLTDALCARLTARSLATHTLRLYLRLDTGSIVERSLVLPMPMRDARTLHRLLHMDLEAHPPGSPVTGVRLLAEPVQPRVVQNGLFVPLAPEPEKLELTLARIGHIVGKDRLGAVELLDTHRPDAFVLKRFDTQASRGQAPPERRSFPATPIALRHFRPPIDAGVTLRWGTPARIAFQHVHERILTASGPWRNTGGWWQDEPWARDEWDISIVTSGQSVALYRIYLDLSSQRWFVEGIYD